MGVFRANSTVFNYIDEFIDHTNSLHLLFMVSGAQKIIYIMPRARQAAYFR